MGFVSFRLVEDLLARGGLAGLFPLFFTEMLFKPSQCCGLGELLSRL